MKDYRSAFPGENIYAHMPYDRLSEDLPALARYTYVFIWRALTPTGRVSKYFHWVQTNDPQGHTRVNLPRLRKGYQWTGPYLYGRHRSVATEQRREVAT